MAIATYFKQIQVSIITNNNNIHTGENTNYSRNTTKLKVHLVVSWLVRDGFGNEGPLPAALGSSSLSSSLGFHQRMGLDRGASPHLLKPEGKGFSHYRLED